MPSGGGRGERARHPPHGRWWEAAGPGVIGNAPEEETLVSNVGFGDRPRAEGLGWRYKPPSRPSSCLACSVALGKFLTSLDSISSSGKYSDACSPPHPGLWTRPRVFHAHHSTSLNPSSPGKAKHTHLRDQQAASCQIVQLWHLAPGQKGRRKMEYGRSAGQGAHIPSQ